MIITYRLIDDYKTIIIGRYSTIFEKTKELLNRLEKTHLPKLDGSNILYALKEPSREHIDILKNISSQIPDYIEVELFLNKELMEVIGRSSKKDSKYDFEKFMDYALSLPLDYETGVIKKIYYNFNGTKEDILNLLDEFIHSDDNNVTYKRVLPYLNQTSDTYASDVLKALLQSRNTAIKTLDKFILSLSNRQVAFYVLKKEISKFYKAKLKYMNTLSYPKYFNTFNIKLIENFTIYDLVFLYNLFSNIKVPEPYIILKYYERRK